MKNYYQEIDTGKIVTEKQFLKALKEELKTDVFYDWLNTHYSTEEIWHNHSRHTKKKIKKQFLEWDIEHSLNWTYKKI